MLEDFEYVKPSRADVVANIKADRKMLNDVLHTTKCSVMEDSRKKEKHKKRNVEHLLDDY